MCHTRLGSTYDVDARMRIHIYYIQVLSHPNSGIDARANLVTFSAGFECLRLVQRSRPLGQLGYKYSFFI